MTVLLFGNALLGLLLAAILLRTQWHRHESQWLASAVLLDVARAAITGVLVGRGVEITSALPSQVCLIGRILVLYPLLEFAYAFPLGGRPPLALRRATRLFSAAAAIAALHPDIAVAVSGPWLRLAYFIPMFAIVLRALHQNLTLSEAQQGLGARLVMCAIACRFVAELVTETIIRPYFPEYLGTALTADLLVTVSSYVALAHVVLSYRSFRMRAVVTEALLYGLLSLACITLAVVAAERIVHGVEHPVQRAVSLGLVVLLPTLGWALMQRYSRHLESVVLCPIDPRRRLLKGTLERVIHKSLAIADASAVVKLTLDAIADLTRGRAAIWTVAQDGVDSVGSSDPESSQRILPELLKQHLEGDPGGVVHRHSLDEIDSPAAQAFVGLGVDAVVAVRAQSQLLCAIALEARDVDRDTLETAKALADNLASRLLHQSLSERARDLQRQLEASRRLATLGSFAAAIAHDIRTPLTSVKMNLQMVRRAPELSETMQDCADLALEELARLNDYVSGILDYVKPVQLRTAEFDVQLLIEETARTLQPLLEARNVRLHCELRDAAALPAIRADASRLKQVLVNLLENAADASGPGNTIQISTDMLRPDRVAIRVTDEGHGIATPHLDRIFEPFFTTRADGTGLGLAIVNKLVRAHDGEVRVDSAPGRGSTFTVVLPA